MWYLISTEGEEKEMKCANCNKEIPWGDSYGHNGTCICNECFDKILEQSNKNLSEALF